MHPKRLKSRILRGMHRANRDYQLIQGRDRILVAMSGGKDSYGLWWGLSKMRAAAPQPIELVLYHLDQGQPGHDIQPIEQFMQSTGLPYEIEYQDTYSRVVELTEPGKIYCSVCSRFRRAILYKAATRHGCNKVALGHHRDDLIETLLLNIFYSGQIKSMPPRLLSRNSEHELIRPLCYVPEEELMELAETEKFPIMPCQLCGTQETQRAAVKRLLQNLSEQSPHIKGNILNALANVQPSHLLDATLNPLFRPQPRSKMSPGPIPFEDSDHDACVVHKPVPAANIALPLIS